MVVDFFLFFYLLAQAPKFFFRKKTYLFDRLFSRPPSPTGGATIWIHAVSVGEVKAAQPLYKALSKLHPNAFFLITTATLSGQLEAKRLFPLANAFRFLPLDFSWNVRRWVKKLTPKFFFLIESDVWPNLLLELQKGGTKTILASGKISERSFHRFLFFPRLSKKLFDRFTLICAQNKEHYTRFFPLVSDPSKLHIAGNLKFDLEPAEIDLSYWREKLNFPAETIALTCTHAPEEELILETLPLNRYFIILAPRHPERFEAIASLLSHKKIPFFRWSRLEERRGGERVLLVDAMGKLPIIYSLSRLAIIAGSYTDKVGGHNILEPSLYGIPVFFGPHMFCQKELASYILKSKAGKQVPLQELRNSIDHFFNSPQEEFLFRQATQSLALFSNKVTQKILSLIGEDGKV